MATPPTHPRLLIFVNNHFDPTWRRCWDRSFAFEGQTFVSYADLEATYMLDNLALAEAHPEYAFEAESAIVVRKFLARHPEQREALLALAREGRFAVTGAGEAIVDSNMVLGESLIRNYLIGLLWVEETFGQRTRLAVRYDAFGNSAQLPQILRGCEMAWVTGLSYTPATGIYWRGLDGSTVVHRTLPIAAVGGGNTKYPPCPACHGTREIGGIACDACDGRGIQLVERAWLPGPINDEALAQFAVAVFIREQQGAAAYEAAIESFRSQYNQYLERFPDAVIGQPVEDYTEGGAYFYLVYQKGPLFFADLADEFGYDAVIGMLRDYFAAYRYEVAEPQDMLNSFEATLGEDLNPLFEEWVGPFPVG